MDQNPQISQNQPNQFAAPEPQKKKTKTITLVILTVLLIAGFAAGGWWYGTNQAQKESDAKVAELNAKIAKLESENKSKTEEASGEATVPSEADLTAIDKALTTVCNDEAKNQIYKVVDAEGNQYVKINSRTFAKVGQQGTPKFYKNTVIIGASCHDAAAPDEANGGYVSILQRQSDGSWKQVLGVQDTPSCTMVKQYSISKELVPTCIDGQGSTEVANTIK